MQNWQPTNPVEKRLIAAHKDWLAFAQNDQARLLYWQTNDTDIEMVKVFFSLQEQMSGSVQVLEASFETPEQYTQAMVTQMTDYYNARREATRAEGEVADWQPPPHEKEKDKDETPTAYLLKFAHSLMDAHPLVFPGMVWVLLPGRIKGGAKAWQNWLAELLDETCNGRWQSDRIRFVQYGTEPPQYEKLIEQWPQQVMTVQGHYNMHTVPREIVAQSGERGPSGQFRRLLVQLSETMRGENVQQMEGLRDAALAVSTQQAWHGQSAVVQLIAGAAYLKWKKEDQAHDAYGQAAQAGRQAQQAGDQTGGKLVINGLAGQAGVNVTRKKYKQAASEYEEAAKVAEQDKDGLMAVEMRRMQGWCLEQAGRHEPARQAGFCALADGDWLTPELREEGSLKLVSGWMWKQTTGLGLEKERRALEERLEALYGEGWEQKVLGGAQQQGLKVRGVT
jgi:hypothetical protein